MPCSLQLFPELPCLLVFRSLPLEEPTIKELLDLTVVLPRVFDAEKNHYLRLRKRYADNRRQIDLPGNQSSAGKMRPLHLHFKYLIVD